MFKPGDKVRFVGDYEDHLQEPSVFTDLTLEGLCKKYKNIFTIEYVYAASKKYVISEDELWTFNECELEPYLDVDAMDSIIYGITSQIQDEKGPSVEYPREIKCLGIDFAKNEIPTYEDYKPKEKENTMKILELYQEKQTKLIEHKYDKQLEELEKNDELQVYLEQAAQIVKDLMELKDEERVQIEVVSARVNLTPKTIQKREEIIKLIREEKAELNNKIVEIQALLELAPNYEEKIQILRDYEIIDKKKNIIL